MSVDMIERVPPHDTDTELAVLAAITINNVLAYDDVMRHIRLYGEKAFYKASHQVAWLTMSEMLSRDELPEIPLLRAELKRTGRLEEVGGIEFLNQLAEEAVLRKFVGVGSAAQRLAKLALRRRLIEKLQQGLKSAYETGFETADEFAQKLTLNLSRVVDEACPDHAPSFGEAIDGVLRGSGGEECSWVTDLETLHGPGLPSSFDSSNLVVVMGAPGVGKSSLLRSLALQMAGHGTVLVLAFEEGIKETTSAFLGGAASVQKGKIYHRVPLDVRELSRLHDAATKMRSLPIVVDPAVDASISYVAATARGAARRAPKTTPLVAVIVDYIQLMSAEGANRNLEIGTITRSLKLLAKELNCVIFAGAQISRESQRGRWQDSKPKLKDARDSGSIEQDANIVLSVWRRDKADPKARMEPWADGITEVTCLKYRGGRSGGTALMISDGAILHDPLECQEWASKVKDYEAHTIDREDQPRLPYRPTDRLPYRS